MSRRERIEDALDNAIDEWVSEWSEYDRESAAMMKAELRALWAIKDAALYHDTTGAQHRPCPLCAALDAYECGEGE